MNRRVAIIAALYGEIKPLVAGWEHIPSGKARQKIFRRVQNGVECLAIAGGMGARATAQAVETASAGGPLEQLISIGWAGGLSCGVKPGVAYSVGEVIDPRTGERYPVESAEQPPLRLVTADHIVQRGEKRRLAESYAASLVDMEAVTVSRLAAARGIPFRCWKAVSDLATDELPDFNRSLSPDGQLDLPRLLMRVSLRPGYWPALMRMGRNSAAGAIALSNAVTDFLTSKDYANSNG